MTKTNRSDLRLMIKSKGYKSGRNVMTCYYQQNNDCLHFNLLKILRSDRSHFSKTKHKFCPYQFKFKKRSQEKLLMRNIKFSIDTLK